MHDPELIYSWTPREFRSFVRGAQLRDVDEREKDARMAIAMRYAQNAKRPKERRIFDAPKARKLIKLGRDGWRDARQRDIENIRKLSAALKGFKPDENFQPKGGSA